MDSEWMTTYLNCTGHELHRLLSKVLKDIHWSTDLRSQGTADPSAQLQVTISDCIHPQRWRPLLPTGWTGNSVIRVGMLRRRGVGEGTEQK